MGRTAHGVIGIRLAQKDDYVVGMSVVQPKTDLLVLTETGFGKRVALRAFRTMRRGSQGVRLISLEGRKTGKVAAIQQVTDRDEELLLISAGGQVVRTDVRTINRQRPAARGVITMRLNEGDRVVGIAAFRESGLVFFHKTESIASSSFASGPIRTLYIPSSSQG